MGCYLDCVCIKQAKRDICEVTRHGEHFGVWNGLGGTLSLGIALGTAVPSSAFWEQVRMDIACHIAVNT